MHIDALDPPECGVAPVAPFVCDEQTANYLGVAGLGIGGGGAVCSAACLGDDVEALALVLEHGGYALPQRFGVKRLAFGFQRHRLLKLGYAVYVGGFGAPRAYIAHGL